MNKSKFARLTALIIAAILVVTCFAIMLVACDKEQSTSGYAGTYYEYDYRNEKNPDSWIELKSNGKWTDGDDSGTYSVKDGKISIMIDGEELMSGTISNGVMVLDFWGMKTTYKKDGASSNQGGIEGSQTVNNDAKVTAITGGTVDGLVVSLEVSTTTTAVDLSGMISVSKDSSWQLYEDITGQVLIPTKYAANLSDGNNTYYIVVNSSDDKINRTYTLNIWKNYYTDVYFYANGELFDILENVSSHTHLDDFRAPRIDGYTFLGWDCEGYYVESHNVRFDAKLRANEYTLTLDANGGNCNQSSKTVTYDDSFTLPVPTRTGYTFEGWKQGGEFITSKDGNSIGLWKAANNATVTAQWTVNHYDITVQADDSNGGTVTNAGTYTYDYGTSHTVTAETKYGYVFIGWYQGSTQVCDSLTYTYTIPASNTTYTAKWIKAPKLQVNNSKAGYTSSLNGKYAIGDRVDITAYTNDGYTWLGWYDGDTKVSTGNDMSYTFTISNTTKTYTAKWCKISVTSNMLGGKVSLSGDTKFVGNEVTLTATTYKGYNFVGWYSGDTKLTEDTTYDVTISNTDKTYTAKFNYYTVTTETNMYEAGTFTQSQKVSIGDTFMLTATTNNGYTWLGWYDGDTQVSSSTSYSFTMTAMNITYTAKWTYYTLTTDANIQEAGIFTNKYKTKTTVGDNVTLSATTNNGYTFIGWFDGETKLSENTNYSFVMTPGDKTYIAKWTYYTITTETNINGAGTYTAINNVKTTLGDIVTLSQSSTNIGYIWLGWFDGETKVSNEDSDSYTFTMPATNKLFTAKWAVLDSMNNFKFDSTQESCTVTGLQDASVTSIIVPDIVTSISFGAFDECNNLTEIELPFVGKTKNFTSEQQSSYDASPYAFGYIFGGWHRINTSSSDGWIYQGASPINYGNKYYGYSIPTSLRKVTITCIDKLSAYSFYGCYFLNDITIPNNVEIISSYAFYDCTGLTSITIPDSVTSIGSYAFDGCSGLTSITIPDSVTSIGDGAFRYCSGLTSITIPFVGATNDGTSNTHFGYIFGASSYNDNSSYVPSSLKEVIITGDTSIGEGAFYKCNGLTSITIPDSVTSIGYAAFCGCRGLTSVTIPDSVTSIGDYAFSFCELTSVTIPDSVTSIGELAFHGCSGLEAVYITDIAKWCEISFYDASANPLCYAHNLYLNGELVTDLIIPDSVTSIGDWAFYDYSGLTSVTIPDSVTSIGKLAFAGCSGLEAVYITDIAKWCEISFARDDANPLYYAHNLYLNGELITDLVIPNNVTSIGDYAFWDCSGLTSLTIPDSVTSIGDYAFWNCSGLTDIYFQGTQSQWNAIQKDSQWDYGVANHCTTHFLGEE